jgi:hypothetical protein
MHELEAGERMRWSRGRNEAGWCGSARQCARSCGGLV